MNLPWALIANLGLKGAETGYNIFNKPKESDFLPKKTMETLDNIISENERNIEGKSLLHAMSKPAIRQAATSRNKTDILLGQQYAKGQLSEGQLAQGRISSGQAEAETVTGSLERAGIQQQQANLQSRSRMDQAKLNVSQLLDTARQQYLGAKQQQVQAVASGIGEMVSMSIPGFQDAGLAQAIGNLNTPDWNNIGAVQAYLAQLVEARARRFQ